MCCIWSARERHSGELFPANTDCYKVRAQHDERGFPSLPFTASVSLSIFSLQQINVLLRLAPATKHSVIV